MVARFWPLGRGRMVTSPFGPRDGGFHYGVDFGRDGGSAGMPVFAVQAGVCLYSGAAQGYGGPDPCGWLVIDSSDADGGGCLEYGHIRRLPHVQPGVRVQAGEQIAVVNPDTATNGGVAPHLHLSDMPAGYDPDSKSDPLPRLQGALEPDVDAILVGGKSMKPDFNEYGVWSPNRQARGGTKVDLFLLHTEEGGPVKGGADRLARWLNNSSVQVSYHYTISQDPDDGGVTVCDVVDTDLASWSCLSGNNRSINLVFAGSKASWTREQWLQQSKAIDVAAYLAVEDAKKYGFTPRVIAPPYLFDPPGISDHNYITQHFRDGTHSDVGRNFPWDVFAAAVAKYSNVQPLPSQPAPSRQDIINQIVKQLLAVSESVKSLA